MDSESLSLGLGQAVVAYLLLQIREFLTNVAVLDSGAEILES